MKTELYACYNKDEEIRAMSSSGGIYFLIGREILKNRGLVFAACYENINVKHKKIKNEQMLMSSMGSKYVPSYMGDTYTEIRNEIIAGKTVLFVGLPCQCRGLQSFIKASLGEIDNNLITIDLICHGIPSNNAWKGYCDSLNNKGFQISSVNMRDKTTGWKNYSWLLKDSDGDKRLENHSINPYMIGFVSDLYNRPSCSNCKFRGIERKTDITLGDYWGIRNVQPEMDDDGGTSLVFIHSERGQSLFKAISDKIISRQAPIDQVIEYNPSIISSSPTSDKRYEFFGGLADEKDFISMVEEFNKKSVNERVRNKVKKLIKKYAKGGGKL